MVVVSGQVRGGVGWGVPAWAPVTVVLAVGTYSIGTSGALGRRVGACRTFGPGVAPLKVGQVGWAAPPI